MLSRSDLNGLAWGFGLGQGIAMRGAGRGECGLTCCWGGGAVGYHMWLLRGGIVDLRLW